jgi:uncharacterized protein YqgC (DUF456 family)
MELVLLYLALAAGLLLIPLGLPGLWLMVGATLIYSYAAPARIGLWTVLIIAVLALVAEVIEFMLGGRYARKYGGSRRAGWGAIIGGLVGAFAGVPVPVVGPMIGAFLGSFAGAFLLELTRGTRVHGATRVATGALVGRVVAVAMKVGLGLVLVVIVSAALLWGAAR